MSRRIPSLDCYFSGGQRTVEMRSGNNIKQIIFSCCRLPVDEPFSTDQLQTPMKPRLLRDFTSAGIGSKCAVLIGQMTTINLQCSNTLVEILSKILIIGTENVKEKKMVLIF